MFPAMNFSQRCRQSSRMDNVMVTTNGTGTLHLLTSQGVGPGLGNIVGTLGTTSTGVTRFLVSFSHNYQNFAFYWDGSGEAVYSIGINGLARNPVGRSWTQATTIQWNTTSVTTSDVSSVVPTADVRPNATTLFIIPEKI